MDAALPGCETDSLAALISSALSKDQFQSPIRRQHALFEAYARNCPVPLPAPGLVITPEIRNQCECFLPLAGIAATFTHLYSAILKYDPILSSTPFYNSLSWADTFAELPAEFQGSANPAHLLASLLEDHDRLIRFIFASFLPGRFYGGIGRYPRQQQFIKDWLAKRKTGRLHCLDAACGLGEDTYGLALLLAECNFPPEQAHIEGWTLEPLEVWAATRRRLPHDRLREKQLRDETGRLFAQGFMTRISFRCADLRKSDATPATGSQFDLILCNGLLGGPILHDTEPLLQTVRNLAKLLAPGGILLAADNFHGGWKQHCPQKNLQAVFEAQKLKHVECGEGIGGLKPD